MIRVSKEIITWRILCSQGGALPDVSTMIANARSAFPDIPEEEIEVADLTEEEFAAALAAQNAPTLEQARAANGLVRSPDSSPWRQRQQEIQPLRRHQQLDGDHMPHIFQYLAGLAGGYGSHADMVFLIGGGRNGVDAGRVGQYLVF